MRYGMIIDLQRCIGCYGCQIFCRAEHATPAGMPWSRLLFYESGRYPAVRRMPLPILCMHCAAPACVDACPTGASQRRADGIVVIAPDKCTGCLNCLPACPYGARHFYPGEGAYFPGQGLTPYEKAGARRHREGAVGKCDFCLARVARGQKPACVENCMTKARVFGDLDDPESEASQLLKDRETFQVCPALFPDAKETAAGFNPSVYYLARGGGRCGAGKKPGAVSPQCHKKR